ncbi:complex I NDUFA9 subunit family protein [Iodobacter fluviatilis]|uniref:NADH dehydrogenase n=1 Tax=Iodobacter fluviatilis TaxID=537 RepID=A0A377SUV0_9NEIS|nr:complex I NDUFA9 subunit family protein [Iodobacter fluviatilis]TCU82193.1 NADH dehydrogenase [Iodobacter fluviatilis]STR45088.1 Putative NADH-flavin reductase [Iodobacter fluviatilis]
MSKILLIGGSGFIGKQLAARLAKAGHAVTLPTRHKENNREDLLPLPFLRLVSADINEDATLTRLIAGQDVVINLVGILQGNEASFKKAHVTLTERIIAECTAQNVNRYLHMSALGADIYGPSMYQRSKGEAEARVKASVLDWTIYRPSVVFGQEDQFLNLFASLLKMAPFVPLAGAETRFQPVWVQDVTRAFALGVTDKTLIGKTLSLVGPKIYTLKELVAYTAQTIGICRPIISLPNFLARVQASVMSLLPNPPLSHDNLDSLRVDNIDTAGFAPELAWQPTALEAIAPLYLAGKQQRYNQLRSQAHRN